MSIPINSNAEGSEPKRIPGKPIAGTIQPNHLDQSAMDVQLLSFYQQWKKLYVAQACGDGRYFRQSEC